MPFHASNRPRFLNLFKMRYPVGAVASIGHRLSGILLLLSLPFLVNGLDLSLRSEADFLVLHRLFASLWGCIALALAAWGVIHHLAAGVRHLLMDAGIGTRLDQARASARWVIALGALGGIAILLRGLA
jgi:succinate dehydrogenase / fumarate reductase cytochrome b subunit